MIDVPEHLSKEQQEAVEALSKSLGGDPRAGLFPNGAAAKDADASEATPGGEK